MSLSRPSQSQTAERWHRSGAHALSILCSPLSPGSTVQSLTLYRGPSSSFTLSAETKQIFHIIQGQVDLSYYLMGKQIFHIIGDQADLSHYRRPNRSCTLSETSRSFILSETNRSFTLSETTRSFTLSEAKQIFHIIGGQTNISHHPGPNRSFT